MRKFLALFLALLMCTAVLSVTAFAEGTPTISVSSETAAKGEEVTVTVSMSNNPGICMLDLGINYDATILEKVSFSGASIGDGNWAISTKAIYSQSGNTDYNGTILTLKFKVLDDAKVGDAPVSISVTAGNWNEDEIIFTSVPGKVSVTVPAHEHKYEVWTQTLDPTCTEKGIETSTCTYPDCGETITREIEPLKHKYVVDSESSKDATCGVDGVIVYMCSKCGDTYSETIEATGNHSFGSWMKVDDFEHKRECADCNETEKAEHVWVKSESQSQAPTCKDDGYDIYVCRDCSDTKKVDIKATGEHVYGNWVDNKDGTHTGVCGCGEKSEPENHTWGEITVTKAATCKDTGEGYKTCSKCGATESVVIPKSTDHTYGKWVKVDADTHKRECSVCGDTQTADHTWNTGMVTKPATCSEKGVKTFTCKDCGATKTEEIPATGEHKYTAKYEEIDEKTHKAFCACGQFITEEHAYTQEGDILTKPTTTKEGQQEMLCVCGAKTTVTLKKVPADYDDVPKTGDITGQIVLFTVSAVAVIAGAAYIVIKRKLVK